MVIVTLKNVIVVMVLIRHVHCEEIRSNFSVNRENQATGYPHLTSQPTVVAMITLTMIRYVNKRSSKTRNSLVVDDGPMSNPTDPEQCRQCFVHPSAFEVSKS